MFADWVMIPIKLRRAVLKQLHSGYSGINRIKAISCSIVYWPNIDSDIEKTIKNRVPCMEAQKNPPRIIDSHWTYLEQPWSKIHMDFVGPINGLSFLVVVDAHSKWPEVFPMKNTVTLSSISILIRLFNQHGQPETLVFDNGTQFTSELFRHFC